METELTEQSWYFVNKALGEQSHVTGIGLVKKSVLFGDLRISGVTEITGC